MRILSTMAGRGILGGLALATLFGVLNGNCEIAWEIISLADAAQA
jgi:hypothetical protein